MSLIHEFHGHVLQKSKNCPFKCRQRHKAYKEAEEAKQHYSLTQKDLLFPYCIGPTHNERTRVQRDPFEGRVYSKSDDFLLSGKGVLWTAIPMDEKVS